MTYNPERPIVLAILAKDKQRFLPLYLQALYSQTVNKKKIHLYIRSNNNTDKTISIIENWLKSHAEEYASVYTDFNDVEQKVERFGEHDWNAERFSVLANIRQKSIEYAIDQQSDYFVVDCDNFILPKTLEELIKSGKQVVAPFLKTCKYGDRPGYSNYHQPCDKNGYFVDSAEYHSIHRRDKPGLHKCDVVHCTYFIKNEVLSKVNYIDGTADYEYVIFSRVLRNNNIPQYLDTRIVYGYLTLREKNFDFNTETWVRSFKKEVGFK